jgi:hypothetical protein
MGVGFCNAVVFAANGFFRRWVKRPDQSTSDLSIKQIYAAGSLTGLVVAFINCPFELLKVRLQTQYSGPGGALVRTLDQRLTIGRSTRVCWTAECSWQGKVGLHLCFEALV